MLRVFAFVLGYFTGGGLALVGTAVLEDATTAPGDRPGPAARVATVIAVFGCGLGGGYFAVQLVNKTRKSDPDYDDRPDPPADNARDGQ